MNTNRFHVMLVLTTGEYKVKNRLTGETIAECLDVHWADAIATALNDQPRWNAVIASALNATV